MGRKQSLAIALTAGAAVALAAACAPGGHSESPTPGGYRYPTTFTELGRSSVRLDIGGPGTVDFLRIVTILPHPDGSFIVVDGGTSQLSFFDPAGKRTAVKGGRGDGPEQFAGILDAWLIHGDSIVVHEFRRNRVDELGPDGRYVRSFNFTAPWDSAGSSGSAIALANGTVLMSFSEVLWVAPQPDPVYFGQRIFRYSLAGTLESPHGIRLPARDVFAYRDPRGGGAIYPDRAYGRVMQKVPESTTWLTGDGTDWSVDQRAPDGRIVATYRVDGGPIQKVTSRDREAYRQKTVAGDTGSMLVFYERFARDMPYPETKPAYKHLYADPSGRIWLETYPELGETREVWIRLDPRTHKTLGVRMPAGFTPYAFTDSLAYGIWKDPDGVEHVWVVGGIARHG